MCCQAGVPLQAALASSNPVLLLLAWVRAGVFVGVQVLQMIPESSYVGLVTFGTHVHVHELGYAECSKAFVFRGSKEYNSSQVRQTQAAVQAAGCAPDVCVTVSRGLRLAS